MPFPPHLSNVMTDSVPSTSEQCFSEDASASPLDIRDMSGNDVLCTVHVELTVHSVRMLKTKVALMLGVPEFCQELVPCGQCEVMRGVELLSKYELSEGVMLITKDAVLPGELLRLTFCDAGRLTFDEVSKQSGKLIKHQHLRANKNTTPVDLDGRGGICFKGKCTLALASPVQLGREWTISVWTMGPLDDQDWRNLVDGTPGDSFIALTIGGGDDFEFGKMIIGDYNSDVFLYDFDFGTLTAGWHHIVAVGANLRTTYYVDGETIGSIAAQSRGVITHVGNRGDNECGEAFGVMSDLRIFDFAASIEQINELWLQA